MKFRSCLLALLVLSLAGSVEAEERKNGDAKQRQKLPPQSQSARRPQTFEEYIADLKSAAQRDKPQPDKANSQLESNQLATNRYQAYKPLNPIIIEW